MFHKHGGNIYEYEEVRDFSANINFRGMAPSVREAAVGAIDASVHYPDPEYRSLKRALSQRENVLLWDERTAVAERKWNSSAAPDNDPASCAEKKFGVFGRSSGAENKESSLGQSPNAELTAHDFICGNGAAELMFALAAARRPRRALLAAPSFYEYEQALAAFGCAIRRFYMKEEEEFRLGQSFLEEVDEQTDIIILGNPNNPTGRLLEAEFLEELLRLCRARGILLVLDESFYDFLCGEDRSRTFSGVSRAADHPNLFVLKSFTKMYAMPGLRFGYGVCRDAELLEQMRLCMQPWNVSLPAQRAAEAAASELAFADGTARLTAENRKAVKTELERLGYRVFPSSANFLLFEGAEDLKEFCLRRGFLIRDCSNFPGLRRGFFRICIRSEEENRALLGVLGEAAAKGK